MILHSVLYSSFFGLYVYHHAYEYYSEDLICTLLHYACFTTSLARFVFPSLIMTEPMKAPTLERPTTSRNAGMRTAHSRVGK